MKDPFNPRSSIYTQLQFLYIKEVSGYFLLGLLYINDLPNCSKKLSFRIFDDDTNMFYTSDKLYHLETVMNEELKLVFEYCIINKLSINFAKTNCMLISSSRSSGSINLVSILIKTYIGDPRFNILITN